MHTNFHVVITWTTAISNCLVVRFSRRESLVNFAANVSNPIPWQEPKFIFLSWFTGKRKKRYKTLEFQVISTMWTISTKRIEIIASHGAKYTEKRVKVEFSWKQINCIEASCVWPDKVFWGHTKRWTNSRRHCDNGIQLLELANVTQSSSLNLKTFASFFFCTADASHLSLATLFHLCDIPWLWCRCRCVHCYFQQPSIISQVV